MVEGLGGTALPVVADRIKWKLRPSFDPLPFLTDPVVHAAYQDPNVLRKPKSMWPRRPRAKVHCARSELLRLAEKWDKLGALQIIPISDIPDDEAVGLFAVGKDAAHDRLIVNPTVVNSRMYKCNNFTKRIAPGHLISLLQLEPTEDLLVSSDDLCEMYYTFIVSKQRASRNAI